MTRPDQIDVEIIRVLRQDSSLSSREIAARLYLSPRTVRSRIERLRDTGIIRTFTVSIDRERCGYPATADIVAQVEAHRVQQVAERIAAFHEVSYVAITTGSQDISIQVFGHSTDDIHRFVMERLAPLPGVIRINTFVLFKVVKEPGSWSPDLAPSASDRNPHLGREHWGRLGGQNGDGLPRPVDGAPGNPELPALARHGGCAGE
ncbi:MAG: Lrp/AsnC family transcriptional regulator [Dehalococcoidia bacterium]